MFLKTFSRLALTFNLVLLTTLVSCTHVHAEKPTYYIYLAGPEVFLPNAVESGKSKQARIQALNQQNDWPFTLVGLYPLDNSIEDFGHNFDTGIRIYEANIELMDKAHTVAANMVRFRGPSMDVGTAFEMGYMNAANKPVFAYYEAKPFYGKDETPGLFADRVREHYPVSKDDPYIDADGQSIENFEMSDNLMMIGAMQTGNGDVALTFDDVILQIADYYLSK